MLMSYDISSETIALAALFQSAAQIQSIARFGTVDEHATAPLMRALVITDPEEVSDIYSTNRLSAGLNLLATSLDSKANKQAQAEEMVKIAYNIMTLENSIIKNKNIFAKLNNQVDILREHVLSLHPDYETAADNIVLDYVVIQEYSKIYSDMISHNFPKLIIYGEEKYLRVTALQEMIRALLLAGIRACVLWNQVGGRRYSLMIKSKEIIECARKLLQQ